jgi:uncharacterized protein YceH (UPF0502 family)
MELSAEEIRVLGCLVEKEATTPDNYPLSTNALVSACNQTTSRDPIVHYTEREVDQTMLALREQRLARTVRGDGQRVHKHKHVLDEALGIDREPLALLSVLMLRGPQTAAELRTRVERYGVRLSSEDSEPTLDALAGRSEPLVRRLPRRPGEREARWVHLLGGEAMAEASANAAPAASSAPVGSGNGARGAAAEQAAELAALRSRVDDLTRRFDALLERLGETID